MQALDIQVIIKGRALNDGQLLLSAFGTDPETSASLVLYSDAGLTNVVPKPWCLSQDGFVINPDNGETLQTVYISEDSYSIQLLDSFGVSVFNPYRQVSASSGGGGSSYPVIVDSTGSNYTLSDLSVPLVYIVMDGNSLTIPENNSFPDGSTFHVFNASPSGDIGINVEGNVLGATDDSLIPSSSLTSGANVAEFVAVSGGWFAYRDIIEGE